MIEQTVDIATPHGATTTFIVHPERDGPHPVILFYMDAPAIREELRDMARRLATAGYYVVLPNLYYRAGVLELGGFATEADRARMFELMASINIPLVMSDTAALLTYIDSDPAARKGPMGAVGYCMSGQYAINAAAYYPDKVKAAASIYGVSLVTDDHDSPHLAAQKVQGEVYFACAEIDAYAPLEMVEALAQSVTANGVNGEVELYAGVHHGFAFPQRPAYDKTAAERHWERLLALFKRNL
ncbi:MAG: dienelactone hydrolase family protein [Phenylobacterium sp.]|uniref:dienelactone hydrolase family protein n=1 Tax=Phenylobacterium sp. TaxID=1871053 RepID=UPI0027172F38|nr:dienelactone hydrolase family protein [Phenylobacterium sp.]MDO8914198.1 dienelactone hydrolase family protein [Phenylobacterium sp.]MDP3101521.1 dienelactone hydrolase family protein [Phenylobacterium sp.]MDP3632156.1 dienelactone hydrolase family protein [Phenylobacterium sp.]MDP3870531.1 dienelactone hydrolase family protein [Phenylobacterium sp.]HQT52763.1 dienelactone hydrolase family protein [Phenylobacterium sp.]